MSKAQPSVFEDLTWRGLVYQASDERLPAMLDAGEGTAYIGFDPSGDSLHVGHLIQLFNLRRLQQGGNRPIVLAGGATGMIGDPSGKSAERNLLSLDEIVHNVEKVSAQLTRVLDFTPGPATATLVNNFDWLGKESLLGFLRDVGKHITVNQMIHKESVQTRLMERESGISYTEFSYMLLQAADFLHLYDAFGCNLQMGASDQWGNITTGIELVRKSRGATVYGLTSPLLLKADGTKFGKSEKGAVYLDAARTSVYEFYQFFLRSEDASVGQYLKFFTFLSWEEITELEISTRDQPEERRAQHALAGEVTRMFHGEEGLALARQASEALFSTDVFSMDQRALEMALAGAPAHHIGAAALGQGVELMVLLAESGLAQSRSQARKLIEQGGIYLNNRRISDAEQRVTTADVLPGGRIMLRRGKKEYVSVVVEQA
ncbi:MAG: tyrosine--tRNA ligase [Actinomycetota bacterium]|nr:tyrosine--tRNA ligase [Actinomycetota bacterium]